MKLLKLNSHFCAVINFVLILGLVASCVTTRQSTEVGIDSITPNDGKDDTEQLQKLFNNLRPNQHLEFPAGTFIVSEPLIVRVPGVKVSGQGDETIFKFSNDQDLYARYKKRVGVINVVANDVTITNLKIDQNFRASGRRDGQKPKVGGIIIGGVFLGRPTITNGVVITGCTIYDYYGDGISAFNARTNNIRINNNHLISTYIVQNWSGHLCRGGEQAISVTGGRTIQMNDNIIEGALDDAIATHAKAYDVVIKNNKITSTCGRVLVSGGHGVTVDNNEIIKISSIPGSGGIWVTSEGQHCPHGPQDQSENVFITNNVIKVQEGVDNGSGYLIRLFGAGDNVVIDRNHIEAWNFKNNGIQITDRIDFFDCKWIIGSNYTISNNYIANCTWPISIGAVCPPNTIDQLNVELFDNELVNNKGDIGINRNRNPIQCRKTKCPHPSCSDR